MFPILIAMLLVGLPDAEGDPAKGEVQLLLDTIESLQQPVEDFRCEFEGTIRYESSDLRSC